MKASESFKNQLREFLPFLEAVQREPTLGGEWVIKPGQFPWVRYTDRVNNLRSLLSTAPHLWDLNYLEHLKPNWESVVGAVDKLPKEIMPAIVTGVVRGEKFTDGFLLEILKNGSLYKVVRRLCEEDMDF